MPEEPIDAPKDLTALSDAELAKLDEHLARERTRIRRAQVRVSAELTARAALKNLDEGQREAVRVHLQGALRHASTSGSEKVQ